MTEPHPAEKAEVVQRVLARAAQVYGVTVDEILGSGRDQAVVNARHVAITVVRDRLGWSYPRLAKAFRRADHTSAMNAVDRIHWRRLSEPRLADAYSEIENAVLTWREEREIEALDM